MTDAQFSVLVGCIGGGLAMIAAAIRFAAMRIINALDANANAMIKHTESNAILATKIDGVVEWVRDTRTPAHGVPLRAPTHPAGG